MPFDPIEIDDFRTGQPVGCTIRSRHIVLVPFVDDLAADHSLGGDEAEWAAAGDFLDRLERIGRREPLRHDKQGRRPELGETVQHEAEGTRKPDGEPPVVRRRHLRHPREQCLAHRIARRPPPDRGNTIAATHRLPVMEAQPVAQGEGPQAAVVFDGMALDHLRLRLQLAVDAVQLVPDHHGVVARNVGGGHDRIDDGQVGLRNEAQHVCGTGSRHSGQRRCGSGRGSGEEVTSPHIRSPDLPDRDVAMRVPGGQRSRCPGGFRIRITN